MNAYAELAVTTNFSFLRGASHPQEMVAAADELGLAAIGIADRNSSPAWCAPMTNGRKQNIKLLVGTRLVTVDGFEVLAYPTDRASLRPALPPADPGNLRAKKGECHLTFEEILAASEGQMLIACSPPRTLSAGFRASRLARALLRDRARPHVSRRRHYLSRRRARRLGVLAELGEAIGAPLVATNDVHYHAPERRPLADVLTCIREKCTIAEAGLRLAANAERHLKPPAEMARLFAGFPGASPARSRSPRPAASRSTSSLRISRRAGAARQDRPAASAKISPGRARGRYRDAIPTACRTTSKSRLDNELRLIAQARLRALLPDRPRHRRLRARRTRTSSARAAARRPTAPSATASASPRSIPTRAISCSPASSPRTAASRPTSTSTSSTSGARR